MGKPRGGKKKKVELVFDEKKRRDFLTGFSKRKQERRKKAKEELEKQVKEERKRIKQELREGFQEQFKQSFAPIELEGKLKEEEYDTENVTVQIVELSPEEIARSNNWIGANRPLYNESEKAASDDDGSEQEDENDDEETAVPGFSLTTSKKPKKTIVTENGESEAQDDTQTKRKKKRISNLPDDLTSKRAVGQFLAKKTQNTLRHTKAFRTKDKLEKIRNKKKARIEKEKRIKLQNKRDKHKKNPTKTPPTNKFSRKSKARRK